MFCRTPFVGLAAGSCAKIGTSNQTALAAQTNYIKDPSTEKQMEDPIKK
jgi:hypothetical protein